MEITQQMRQKAKDYKRNIAGKFMLVEGANIKSRIAGEDFCVTRKIDGHMQCLFFSEGEVVMLNSNGVQKAEQLKCLDMYAGFLGKSGLKSAVIAAELYLPREGERPRCGDVMSALADSEKKDKLALAPFDIIELDGEPFAAEHYKDVHAKLIELFKLTVKNDKGQMVTKTSGLCKPVEMKTASSTDEVKAIYEEWVEGQGAEGIVVHSETRIISKVKPRHSVDAAVVGYTTSDNGLRDMMLAVRREDGFYQVFAHGSNGMTDEQRVEIAERLSTKHVESQYVLSDSRGVAYQMVRPEIVFEISALEFVTRGNDNKIKLNALINFDEERGWLLEGMTPGVSVLGLTISRERDDKQTSITDVRISQITDICPFEERESNAEMKESTLLERRIFKKVTGEKIMLHKFLIWKTNKEDSGRYPAYVFYHTDFSNSRKEMIKRDMTYSSDEQQIRAILEAEIADNIKKGWIEI